MDKRIQPLVNLEGQTVYPVFAPAKTSDGRTINRHFGTFASAKDAAKRCHQIDTGTLPRWEEPE